MMILNNPLFALPNDIDKQCIDICNILNRLPETETYESCAGHGKRPFWVFFRCRSIDTLSRLGRAISKNYSDGNWEIVIDSCDGNPCGCFWLRSKTILKDDELNESIKRLCENILYWFDDNFDEYFINN